MQPGRQRPLNQTVTCATFCREQNENQDDDVFTHAIVHTSTQPDPAAATRSLSDGVVKCGHPITDNWSPEMWAHEYVLKLFC